jgi:hypothetical protein
MDNIFNVLGRERSLAESCARLLNDHGRDNPGVYAQGIMRYAQAKAEFDGLIEETKHYLTEDVELFEVAGLKTQLQTAVDRRTDFTDFVEAQIIGNAAGTKFGLGDLLKPADLLKALTDGLRALWQEYRAVKDTRHKETMKQLEDLKWLPFQDLIG